MIDIKTGPKDPTGGSEQTANLPCPNPDVTILVPTLNEVENIDPLVERVLAGVKGAEFSIEIVFVDGGSKDGTQEKVRAWETKGPVRLEQSDGKGGLSGDIVFGAAAARTETVVVMDADLSHPPEALPALIRPVLGGTHDMAVGSRYIPGGAIPGWPFIRRLSSRTATILAWPLVTVKDPMSGFFAVRRERLLSLGKEATGFKIALEIAARGGDSLRVTEVPITFIDRERGTSKFGSAEVVSFLKQIILLSGGAVSTGSTAKFAVVGSLGVIVDYIIFSLLLHAGCGVVLSHISSFTAATVFNYFLNARWAFARTARLNTTPQWRLYLSFLSVCVLALLFRGAVLAILTDYAGWSPQIAIFFAIAAAVAVNFAGSAFFVFPRQGGRATPEMRWRVFALFVTLYAILIRLSFVGIIDLIPEETYYWNYAQRIDFGYLDHPPLVAWLIGLGTAIAGKTELGVRLFSLPLWGITAFFSYRLARNLFGKTAAVITLMLLATLPIYFFTGFLMIPDTVLYAAWAGCLYFIERAVMTASRRAWLGAGICLGVGMLSKYSIILLVPAAMLFLACDRGLRSWLRRPEPYAAVAVGCAIFSPVILWNATHGWASFLFQGVQRWSGSPHISLHLFVASILVLLTPVGLAGAVGAMDRGWDRPAITSGSPDAHRKRLFTLFFTLLPLSIFFSFSLLKEPRVHWTGPVWLAILPLVGGTIAFGARGMAPRSWYMRFYLKMWKPTVIGLLLLYGGLMYYVLVGAPGLTRFLSLREAPVAWEETGREFGAIVRGIETRTGKKPLVVGMDNYPLSSELSYYLPGRNTFSLVSGRHLFGRESLMWSYWYPAWTARGRDILLVDYHAESLSEVRLVRYFTGLGPLEYVDVLKKGRRIGRLYYRLGYGYQDRDDR